MRLTQCVSIKPRFLFILVGLSLSAANAVAVPLMEQIDFMFGPRVGVSVITIDKADFTALMRENDFLASAERNYMPVLTSFGISLEQRVNLGTTDHHFAVQEIITLAGLDQSLILPNAAALIGFRGGFGLELGLGPIVSVQGFAVAYALGWNFKFSGVNLPVDLVFIPDWDKNRHNISLYTGFNF